MGTDTACASRYAEKSQGKDAKPPTSRTIEGTAVATIVESIATRPVESIRAMRIGPRVERKPTPSLVVVTGFVPVVVHAGRRPEPRGSEVITPAGRELVPRT